MPEHPYQIDRYRILHEIGSGGMATVYAAIQPRPRRTVALKVLKNEAASDTAVRRFKREAEILARLRHPSIAQVFDAGTYEIAGKTRPFFVMEYIPGAKTILEYVAQKQFNRRDRLKLFVSVCRAVEYGHKHRVLHRDLKPANILIDQSGQLKIIDFGVASAPDLKVAGTTMNTEAGVLVGTIQYMSPEQMSSQPQDLDPRSDVYSLGVLLYKLMTGQFPHDVEGLPIYEAIRMIREDEPIRPSARDSELKGDLETIILRGIAKDCAQRYQSAGALAADIVQFLNRQPIQAKPHKGSARTKSRARMRALGIAVIILLLLAAGAGGWWWTHRQSPQKTPIEPTAGATGEPILTPSSIGEPGGFGRRVPKATAFVLDSQDGRITAIAFDATGNRVASGAHDNSIVIWDIETKTSIVSFHEHDAVPIAVNFAADGRRCISIDESGELYRWNVSDARIKNDINSPCGSVLGMAISADGERIALACRDSTVRIGAMGQTRWIVARGTTGEFYSTAYSPDGTFVLGGSARGDIYIWNSTGGERVHRLSGLNSQVVWVCMDENQSHILGIAEDGDGMVWEVPNDTSDEIAARGRRFDACEGIVVATSLSPSKQWLAVASADSLRIWDLNTLAETGMATQLGETARTTQRIYSIAIDNDATKIAIGFDGGEVHVREVETLVGKAKD